MPRRMRDGRNPYGSAGGYVTSRRGRRDRARGRDRGNEEDFARQYATRNDYARNRDYQGGGSDYGDIARGRGRDRGDYAEDMARGRDGHYGQGYMPIEAMGYFNGYYGMGEDYARGRRRDYAMDYGDYEMDYGYDMARGGRGRDRGQDYGEGEYLEDEDIEEWSEKLKKELDEKDKQFFSKENIKQKAEQMGIKFDKYSMEEFEVTALMVYTDYCKTLGTANMDIYLRLAKDWLEDKDAGVKYGEKLASYYDNVVEPE